MNRAANATFRDGVAALARRQLAQFGRVTSSRALIAEVDGLRFVAIGMVVLFHFAGMLAVRAVYQPMLETTAARALDGFAARGELGVPLFFVLSGFVMGLPFADHALGSGPRVVLPRYYVRRLTRLEPPYVLCMLFFFALLVFEKHVAPAALAPHLLASLGYVHNLVYARGSSLLGAAWSLEIEVQFYLLAPLLARVYRVASPALRRGILVGVSVAAAVLQHWLVARLALPRPRLSLFNFVQYFLAGMLVADVYIADWRAAPARGVAWDGVWLAVAAALLVIPPRSNAVRFVAPVLFGLLLVATFRAVYVRRALTARPVVVIGGMCYSLYLFHTLAIAATLRRTTWLVVTGHYTVNFALQLAVASATVVLAGAAYFRLVERPFMRWQWPSRPARLAPAVAALADVVVVVVVAARVTIAPLPAER